MKTLLMIVAILTALICLSFFIFAQSPAEIEGNWQGVLKVSGIELRIVFKITKNPEGTYSAIMNSPDQTDQDIPVGKVTYEEGRLVLEVTVAKGIYEGTVKADGSEIEGDWKQSGMTLPLNLKKLDKPFQLNRPQEPKPPFPYHEENVTYKNEKAGVIIGGTLSYPESEGPFAAVLLITGSGPQDRNESLLGHKPFLVLADYLTRHGLAVLRVDDRGVGKSTGNLSQSTSADLTEDVLDGIAFLKNHPRIDSRKIGLIGHSEGGIIAPMAAVKSPDVAFIVLMAGTGLTGEEILYLQAALIAKASGSKDEEIEKNKTAQSKVFEVLKKENNPKAAEDKLRTILQESFSQLSEEEKKAIGDVESRIQAEISNVNTRWFRFFLTYDPTTTLRKVKCPVLALNGKLDLQVPYKENLQAIEGALRSGGNTDFTTLTLPSLNHLFQKAETGTPAEYGKIEETISPEVLKLIGDWILERVR